MREEACVRELCGIVHELETDVYLANPTDILIPGLLVKTQVLIQSKADIITIQPIGKLVHMKQVLLESASDGGLLCVHISILTGSTGERSPTLPLALRPVSQTVTPF